MNTIHPTALIGTGARMGTGNVIGPFVVIGGDTQIGDNNWIGTGSILGSPPEIRSHPHSADWINTVTDGGLVIGDDNVIRESVQLHAGSLGPTILGSGLFLMNQCYVGHDGTLQDGVTLASSVVLAGHVSVGRGANLGLNTSVHQGRVIGAYAMVGMGSIVTRDIPPFSLAFGSPAKIHGVNSVGMTRAGFSDEYVKWARSGSDTKPPQILAADIAWYSQAIGSAE